MPAKFVPPDPAALLQQWKLRLQKQPRVAWVSYGCALVGVRYAVHDFHHYDPDRFGRSTPLLGAAILLYAWSRRGRTKHPLRSKSRP